MLDIQGLTKEEIKQFNIYIDNLPNGLKFKDFGKHLKLFKEQLNLNKLTKKVKTK